MAKEVTGSLKIDNTAPNILIILMGSLGDVARGMCIAHQLKENFPGCKVTWLIEPACRELISLNHFIDNIIIFDRARNIFALPDLIRQLRKEKFDITLDLQRHFKSGFFSMLSRAPVRIGFYPSNSKEFNHLFNNYYIEDLDKSSLKIDHYLAFIKKIGGVIKYPLDFGLSKVKEDPNQKEMLISLKKPYIGVVLASSWKSKDWPGPHYIELLNKVIESTGFNLVLIGDKNQDDIAVRILASVKEKERVINKAGKTSLADVVSIIDESELCLGPDSGPGHIAGALQRNYISFFGPTDPKLTAPLGQEELVLKSNLGCMPCYKRVCPGLGGLCMNLITPDMVIDKVKGIAQADFLNI